MLLSLVLFGSRARGDQRLRSDVDLLGVIEGGLIKDVPAVRGTSFFVYPIESLRQKATDGDLFMLHLSREGMILHDTAGIFRDACDRFVFKKSYIEEITEASGIIWLLSGRVNLLKLRRNRKRLTWALRTILIARAAETKEAVFSSAALAAFADLAELKSIIDRRQVVEADELVRASLGVVERFGVSKRALGWVDERSDQEALVSKLGSVASSTVQLMRPRKLLRRPADARESDPYV